MDQFQLTDTYAAAVGLRVHPDHLCRSEDVAMHFYVALASWLLSPLWNIDDDPHGNKTDDEAWLRENDVDYYDAADSNHWIRLAKVSAYSPFLDG